MPLSVIVHIRCTRVFLNVLPNIHFAITRLRSAVAAERRLAGWWSVVNVQRALSVNVAADVGGVAVAVLVVQGWWIWENIRCILRQ